MLKFVDDATIQNAYMQALEIVETYDKRQGIKAKTRQSQKARLK